MFSTSEGPEVVQGFGNDSSVFFYLIWLLQHENEDLNNDWSSPGGTRKLPELLCMMDNAGVRGSAQGQGMEQNPPQE